MGAIREEAIIVDCEPHVPRIINDLGFALQGRASLQLQLAWDLGSWREEGALGLWSLSALWPCADAICHAPHNVSTLKRRQIHINMHQSSMGRCPHCAHMCPAALDTSDTPWDRSKTVFIQHWKQRSIKLVAIVICTMTHPMRMLWDVG